MLKNRLLIKLAKFFSIKIAKKKYVEKRILKIEPGYETKYMLRKNKKVHLNIWGCGTLKSANYYIRCNYDLLINSLLNGNISIEKVDRCIRLSNFKSYIYALRYCRDSLVDVKKYIKVLTIMIEDTKYCIAEDDRKRLWNYIFYYLIGVCPFDKNSDYNCFKDYVLKSLIPKDVYDWEFDWKLSNLS